MVCFPDSAAPPFAPIVSGVVVLFVLVGGLTGCGDMVGFGGGNDGTTINDEQSEEEFPAPDIVVDIDTVAPDTASAGDVIDVDCAFLNPDGDPIELGGDEPDSHVVAFPESAYDVDDYGDLIVYRSGPLELTCQSEEAGLIDADPAIVEVTAGPIETTIATVEETTKVAGDDVQVVCEGYDEYGNRTTDADFDLTSDIGSSHLDTNDDLVTTTTEAGLFTVYCDAESAAYRFGDPLEVLPGKPSTLQVALMPDQNTYRIGQVITFGAVVEDRFGNPIRHPELSFDLPPEGESLGNERVRFDAEGTYSAAVEVDEETDENKQLREEFEVHVNHTGPDISCFSPYDGEMLEHAGGLTVDLDGAVADEHGVDEVTVDGEQVDIDSDGNFSTTVSTRHGINFVEIAATDDFGEQNVRTCAFMTSFEYADEYDQIDDAISLQLRQDAIDDKDYNGADELESLNDLILTVLNSDGLREDIEDAIKSGNPYDPDSCGFDVYVHAIYFDGDPHVTELDLTSGGVDLEARFNDIHFDLEITDGNWYCPGTYNPTVVLDYVEIEAGAELFLSGGTPMMQLDSIDRVESGEVDAEGGNWFSDAVYSAVTSLFQGTFRDIVEDTFEEALEENFDDLFEGLMDSLDVDALSTYFSVPRLDGSGSIALQFDTGFSTVDASSSRALFGLSASITADDSAAHGIYSRGVAHPTGSMLSSPWVSTASGAAHVALLNQALHALWRAGLFGADIGGALEGQLPEGASVELETRLPPMVALGDDEGARLMLGAVEIVLHYPELFDEPLVLDAGASATTDVDISNDTELQFDDLELDELYLSTQDISIDSGTYEVLRAFLGDLLQEILDQTVNAALPALPVPSFTIPFSMWRYDLPIYEDIGLVNSTIDQTNSHLKVISDFGIQ